MEWRAVVGYEGLYEVSDTGLIRSLPRRGTKTDGAERKLHEWKFGYKQICLCKGGICKTYFVHRIVAKAFIPNPNNYREINHKDENPSNNCVKNLEWCDRDYNIHYGSRTQKTRKPVDMYDLNGNFIKRFDGLGIAAIEMSGKIRNQGCIKRCCNGERKTALKHKWRWSE